MNATLPRIHTPKPPVLAQDLPQLKAGLLALLPDLRGRAVRLCSDRVMADDLVQDTVERALRFSAQYVRGTNLRAWAYQILFSVFMTRYRRQRRERKAMRWLATDPCAWTQPQRFAAPDVGSSLTSATQVRCARFPRVSGWCSSSSTSAQHRTATPPRSSGSPWGPS